MQKVGKFLWDFQTGSDAHAPPITYQLDGVQYVVIASSAVKLSGGKYPSEGNPCMSSRCTMRKIEA